jgi:catalase
VDDLGNRLVDAILRVVPDHAEGTRPAHSKGTGAQGFFQPSDVAARYCTAELFSRRVNVKVRFSNASGSVSAPDCAPDVRGMAVKFDLTGGAEADLVAINLPVVPFRTIKDFMAFTAANFPAPVRPVSWFRKALDLLALRQERPEPAKGATTSAEPGVFLFGASHPFALPALLAMEGGTIPPTSYARASYHAVHAFRVTGQDELVRSVRFHWDPVAGARPVAEEDLRSPELNPDYLQDEIGRRLADGPVEFALRMQVADVGDDTKDLCKPWPWRRLLVDMGRLSLHHVLATYVTEHLSFNPTRLVDGISCHDEIFRARGLAYQASWERRSGNSCPFS